jgi:hypothetical protein
MTDRLSRSRLFDSTDWLCDATDNSRAPYPKSGRWGVGGVRKRGSVRFSPYFKVEWFDPRSVVWRVIQKRFATKAEADASALGMAHRWRVMRVTMNGISEA